MADTPPLNGTSIFSKLEGYWTKRPAEKPIIKNNETLIAVYHEHWIKYVFPVFLYVILMTAGFILLYGAVLSVTSIAVFYTLLIIAIILLFGTHHWFFWYLLAESQAHIIITNRRVVYVHENILLEEQMLEVTFEKMKTVEAHKENFLQSVLNYGTLQFESSTKIKRVPHPGTIARQIEQAMGMI